MDRRWVTLAAVATLVASLSMAGTAVASHDKGVDEDNRWTVEGTILVGSPAAEPTEPCNPDSGQMTGNGLVGDIYELPGANTGDGDHRFRFEVTGLAGADLEWYDASEGCEHEGTQPSGQTTLCCHTLAGRVLTGNVTFEGTVPAGSTHVVVNHGGLWPGGPGTYKLELPLEAPGSCDMSPFC